MKLFNIVSMEKSNVFVEDVLSESKRALTTQYTKAGKEVLKITDISNTVFTADIAGEKERFNNAIAVYSENEQKMLKAYFNVLINGIKA